MAQKIANSASWGKCQFGEVSVGESASLEKCQLGEVPVERQVPVGDKKDTLITPPQESGFFSFLYYEYYRKFMK